MKFILKLGLILALLGVITAGGLALLNIQTAPIIARIKAEKQAEARREVARALGAEDFRLVTAEVEGDPVAYYHALGPDSSVVGYVGLARGKGYSSTIETIAGFDTTFEITGLKVTFQQETPGLGDKVIEVKRGEKEAWWLRQFKGLSGLNVAVKQDRGKVDAVTGATITSRAIANSVRELARDIRKAEQQRPRPAAQDTLATATGGGGEEQQ